MDVIQEVSMIKFDQPQWLLLLFSLLPLFFIFFFERIKRIRIFKFYTAPKNIKTIHYLIRWFYLISVMVSLLFLVFAISAPYLEKKEKQIQNVKGEEILFLVDVSRSMLAEDVVPSRLEKVKSEVVNFAENNKGNRYGLIAFAGDAVIKCPMTTDNWFFIQAVKQLRAGSVSRGSTSIAAALNKSIQLLPQSETGQNGRNIIIFTDGEDHEDNPVPAAKAVEAAGGRMLIIAVGDNKTGARIPVYDSDGMKSYLTYNGKEVWSKTDLTTLKKIKEKCRNCAVLPALDGNYDLEKLYHSFNAKMGAPSSITDSVEVDVEIKYNIQIYVAFSLIFILIAIILLEISRRSIRFE